MNKKSKKPRQANSAVKSGQPDAGDQFRIDDEEDDFEEVDILDEGDDLKWDLPIPDSRRRRMRRAIENAMEDLALRHSLDDLNFDFAD